MIQLRYIYIYINFIYIILLLLLFNMEILYPPVLLFISFLCTVIFSFITNKYIFFFKAQFKLKAGFKIF
jgi:hypothetical protein